MNSGINNPQISIDISTYTRKHLLQLLQGLDIVGYLSNCKLFYTEPEDYFTQDNEPYTKGITSIKVIETYEGQNSPSKDKILLLFLGYEGNRATAIWEHLNPNITIAVIPNPPYKDSWKNRTELQNRFLLTSIDKEFIYFSHSLDPSSTEKLLNTIIFSERFNNSKYNFFIAPLGTKPQAIGLYRFIRKNKGLLSLVYASPTLYKEERAKFEAGRTWLIDNSSYW